MAKYDDAQRDTALDAVDAVIAVCQSVNAAMRAVSAETGIPVGTLRGWRARHGRSEPVGDRTTSARNAAEALTALVDEAVREQLETGVKFLREARSWVEAKHEDRKMDARAAADLARAGNAMVGTGTDKAIKRGVVDGAERTKSEVTGEVTLDVSKLTDEQLAKLATDGVLPDA